MLLNPHEGNSRVPFIKSTTLLFFINSSILARAGASYWGSPSSSRRPSGTARREEGRQKGVEGPRAEAGKRAIEEDPGCELEIKKACDKVVASVPRTSKAKRDAVREEELERSRERPDAARGTQGIVMKCADPPCWRISM